MKHEREPQLGKSALFSWELNQNFPPFLCVFLYIRGKKFPPNFNISLFLPGMGGTINLLYNICSLKYALLRGNIGCFYCFPNTLLLGQIKKIVALPFWRQHFQVGSVGRKSFFFFFFFFTHIPWVKVRAQNRTCIANDDNQIVKAIFLLWNQRLKDLTKFLQLNWMIMC